MAKLIRTAKECGHLSHGICFYSDHLGLMNCEPKNEQNFPDNCPLEDGITIKEHLDRILEMHKKPGSLGKSIHRTRQQCVFYHNEGYWSKNNCHVMARQKEGSMVYPKCIGVNCGYYAKSI
jgi:hypothetical protein